MAFDRFACVFASDEKKTKLTVEEAVEYFAKQWRLLGFV